ncbi:BT0820 family HAD-type phosphatase [Salinimicrobium sp. HB62]|uniref:BT0820 family HAD-type phosphatase n=1 Tax=Salinimicrobium sp. HB62 TaxID=3077781 RepID=UPI002D791E4D|nr:hydrolase [Salinimicrobium sp. HB62]
MSKMLTIAVDFDGTLVENRYPKIGKPILFAFETLKKLQQEGHQIILWTYRSGVKLEEAVEYCEAKGIKFYAVNKSYPEEEYEEQFMSRKILADVFIDDRNINGLPPWGEIYHQLVKSSALENELPRKSNGLLKIFKRL